MMGLYYDENLTFREIGRAMGVTESRVCQMHTRAVAVLRTVLGSAKKSAGFRMLPAACFAIFLALSTQVCAAPVAAPHSPTAAEPSRTETVSKDPGRIWSALIEGNLRFRTGRMRLRKEVDDRMALVKGQHPAVIVLSCSDSRVPPERIFDAGLGELFVVRTAGHVVDQVALGSLEYAVEHLGSPVLLVLGHTKCGAVTAAVNGGNIESPNLRAVIDSIVPAIGDVRMRFEGEALIRAAVEANVEETAQRLVLESPLLREYASNKSVTILMAVYDLETGEVRRLER
jgi:carbonic anhydrase